MSSSNNQQKYTFPLLIIGVLFFIFGFITWANSQLIPYLKIACQLTETESYLVGSAFFAAYFFMSIPSSFLLNKIGFKNGMSVGLLIMAIGAIIFIPAAQTRNYSLFLTGLFIIGTGLALLQSASNPYVTILGPIEKAAQRISLMGICNKLAGICAVYVLGSIMLKDGDAIQEQLTTLSLNEQNVLLQSLADRVIFPYIIISTSFAVLAILLYFVKLPEVQESNTESITNNHSNTIWHHKNLIFGAIAIFFYVGAEVISYDAFSTLGKSLGYSTSEAGMMASYTGYAMLLGYFATIYFVPRFISQRNVLILSSILSILLLIIALNTEGITAVISFALLGFTQSAMWPAIWPLALENTGKYTKLGGALLVMMIVGGAVMMPMMGKFVEILYANGIENASKWGFLIMMVSWLYLIWYAINAKKLQQ